MIEETRDLWFQNLKATYEKKDGSFAGHKTGNLIKLFPFTTKYTEGQSDEDLTSFLGVIGECFRLKSKKQFSSEFKGDEQASFKIKLRNHIINNVIFIVKKIASYIAMYQIKYFIILVVQMTLYLQKQMEILYLYWKIKVKN